MATGISGVQACVFDAYGTLFDFASAAGRCKDELGEQAMPLTVLWRDKQLQYTWLRGSQGRHADFWQVTGDALDYAMATLRISDDGLRERLMGLYLTLDPFPEAPATLRTLKEAGYTTAMLSNGTLVSQYRLLDGRRRLTSAACRTLGKRPFLISLRGHKRAVAVTFQFGDRATL